MTGATQPSVEDLVMGAIPGLPRVRLHNPFLAYENGDEFLNLFRRAAEGHLEPFILVVEGSIPDEGNKSEGKYAAFDAELKFNVPGLRVADPKACQCGEILKGVKRP